VVALPFEWPAKADALLATSANALRVLGDIPAVHLRAPLLAVGDATARAAHAAGFTNIHSADGDSEALAALAMQTLPNGTDLLYLAGLDRRDETLLKLSAQHHIKTLEVYEIKTLDQLPRAISDAILKGELDAALHFSPRSAKTYADLVQKAGVFGHATHIFHICISQTARDARFENAIVAAKPRQDSMLDALALMHPPK
jgi:uroporphyrinogen-III synthase